MRRTPRRSEGSIKKAKVNTNLKLKKFTVLRVSIFSNAGYVASLPQIISSDFREFSSFIIVMSLAYIVFIFSTLLFKIAL